MKQIFVFWLIGLLLAVNVYAQELVEYPYNTRLAMSADGELLAIAGRYISDESARLGFRAPIDFYDAKTGILLNSFIGSEDSIESLELNDDGSLLVYSNNNGRLAVVELETVTEINVIVAGGYLEIGTPVWGANDRFAVFSGTNTEIFDASPPRNLLSSYYNDFTTTIFGFDWSEDSNIIAYSTNHAEDSDGIVVILEVLPNFELALLSTIPAPSTFAFAINDTGTAIASNTAEGILITNINDESQFLLNPSSANDVILSLDWNSDGTKLAAGNYEAITTWDIETGEIMERFSTVAAVTDIVWSPDGEYIYHNAGIAGIYRNGLPLQEAIASENTSNSQE